MYLFSKDAVNEGISCFQESSNTTVFNINNNHQKCILSSISIYYNDSDGSRDTEDQTNDAGNPALHQLNKWHFKIYSNTKQLF